MTAPACPYCHFHARLVTGDAIYPHRPDLHAKHFWLCSPCGAWVGTHSGSRKHAPLGRLANADLRRAKQEAHAAFDPIWRGREMHRTRAYQWLADQLGIPVSKCHIGKFDVEMCGRVLDVCRARAEEMA